MSKPGFDILGESEWADATNLSLAGAHIDTPEFDPETGMLRIDDSVGEPADVLAERFPLFTNHEGQLDMAFALGMVAGARLLSSAEGVDHG